MQDLKSGNVDGHLRGVHAEGCGSKLGFGDKNP
jgi:hypothetical protein